MQIDTVLKSTLGACAVLMTALAVHREFFPTPPLSASRLQKTVYVREWREGIGAGVHLGGLDAPVQLIEFADFECPFCAEFEKVVNSLRERYPTKIGLTYVYFPIPGHRFAMPAARVANCAGEQGRFERMHDLLFEEQDAFGLRPWVDFAKQAAVPDVPAFETCIKKTDPIPRVTEGRALGRQLNIEGTPTIIINGWKLGRPPTAEELDGMVRAILDGRSPVTSDGKFAQ
jgi:protein-disulfide isomerase